MAQRGHNPACNCVRETILAQGGSFCLPPQVRWAVFLWDLPRGSLLAAARTRWPAANKMLSVSAVITLKLCLKIMLDFVTQGAYKLSLSASHKRMFLRRKFM